MPTEQTKTTPEPAAVPGTSQPQPAPERYGSSGLIRVRRLLARTSDESREFFEALMDRWEDNTLNLTETAFQLSASALGLNWIAVEAEGDKEKLPDIDTAARIAFDGTWVAGFLRRLFRLYRSGVLDCKTPEGVLGVLEVAMEDFDTEREVAQEVLRDNPEVLATELRELARKRPELFR